MEDNQYSAIEHMMELGMGAALASQMMRTMNECLQRTTVPTVGLQAPQMPQTPARQFYAVVDKNVAGPFDEAQLSMLIQQKKLVAETYVWSVGMPQWSVANLVPEVNKLLILSRP